MTFEQWLTSIGKSPKSAKSYASAIIGTISNWAQDAGLLNGSIINISSLKEFNFLAGRIKSLNIFIEHNKRGNGMYSAALNQYAAYIDDMTGQSVTDDINSINSDYEIPATEKSILISARIGQGKFRQGLIDYWSGCAVTKFTNTRFLIASHIKPWRFSNNQERLDVYNGLLLLPNLDKAFDLGYVSFDSEGKILISKKIDKPETLGINENLYINISINHADFMNFHRTEIFENGFR